MADTAIHDEVETWIREKWLQPRFGREFTKKNARLKSGGEFEFDAVSEDGKVVANISTSSLKTASGNRGSGKINKVRSDIYFLLLAEIAEKRMLVLTESDMYEAWLKQIDRGRVPDSIQIRCVEIPGPLREKLEAAQKNASEEVTPPWNRDSASI
ncbi:MAG: hypothetical protein OYL41_11875 [Acidobacteriota bacterium]|nr:hypothetical protein [Acidobacteriota bacterium]